MSFTKLPAVPGRTACAFCGCGAHDTFPEDGLVAVGFGTASLTKDGEEVWSEQSENHKAEQEKRDPLYLEGKDCEEMAAKDPDHDWRIEIMAPLYEATYQRQGEKHWVLVQRGEGFA